MLLSGAGLQDQDLAGGDPPDHLGQRRGGARAVLARVHGGVVSQAVRRAEVGLGHAALGLKCIISDY